MTDIASTRSASPDAGDAPPRRAFQADRKLGFSCGIEKPPTRTPANVPAGWATMGGRDSIRKPKAEKGLKRRRVVADNDEIDDDVRDHNSDDAADAAANIIDSAQVTAVRKRKVPTASKAAKIKATPLPRSFDEATEADKALITMRDAGTDWSAIRARWKEITGIAPAPSSLPNRYARLKTALATIRSEDRAILLKSKRLVEDTFARNKWEQIAKTMVAEGGGSYLGAELHRAYKKMMRDEGVAPPDGVIDPDFETEEDVDGSGEGEDKG